MRTMKGSNQSQRARWLAFTLTVCLAAGQSSAVGAAPELPDPGNPRITREQQEQLGLQVAAEVYKQMPVLPDSSPETKYVQALGRRLVAVIPAAHSWPYQFHVIAQKEINAFALPGGPMFVNIGTITAADNEAELAGVMAHEMSHVYMQHSAKQQEKGTLLQGLAGIAGAIAGNMGGTLGTLAQTGIQFGAGTLMLKYSRSDEAQADAVGAIILWKAGINPVALADFFEKLAAKGGSGPQFLSDHPNPGNRRAAIQKEIRDWPSRKYSGDSADFANVRKRASGVRAYSAEEIAAGVKSGRWAEENRKNGAVLPGASPERPPQTASAAVPPVSINDVLPSWTFRSANLGLLRIDRPDNWEVINGQQASSVTIAPRAGVSGGAVAYGVVIQTARLDPNMSLAEVTSAIVQNLESSDRNMKQASDITPLTLDGMSASSVELETISPMADSDGKAQRERDWLVTLPRGGGEAVLFIFVSPLAHFGQLRPTFDRMLRSVQF
jgi:Zn-dependent protease with chaperone function